MDGVPKENALSLCEVVYANTATRIGIDQEVINTTLLILGGVVVYSRYMKKLWCDLFHRDCHLPYRGHWRCWWCLCEHEEKE